MLCCRTDTKINIIMLPAFQWFLQPFCLAKILTTVSCIIFVRSSINLQRFLQPSTCRTKKMQYERLVKFKGQLGFKQYMPMKPIKRGIKVWMCADSIIHFVSRFQVNTGQPRAGREHGLGEHVVTKLSSDLEHGYYNINFDNFFPSFGTMKTLLDKRINPTATTQPNRNRSPAPLKTAKLRHGKRIVMQKSGTTACNWQDKKIFNFSTTNCQPTVQRRNRDGTLANVNAPPCFII